MRTNDGWSEAIADSVSPSLLNWVVSPTSPIASKRNRVPAAGGASKV
jgi:hypothetical protein